MQLSTTVRNAMLDATETAAGTSPVLRIYNGVMPADCQTALSGNTQLLTMTLPSDWMANASAGSKAKSGTWSGSGVALGYATFFRIYDAAVANCHFQGLCSQAWAASTAYVLNQQVGNGGNVYKCTTAGTSAGSGGPTGTGAGITDNTAVWAYVGLVDMVLDNTNINVSQVLNVNTFTETAGNA